MSPAELVKLRGDLDLTQRDLAVLLGVERHTVQRWERTENPVPTPPRVDPWLEALRAFPAELPGWAARNGHIDPPKLRGVLARHGLLGAWRYVLAVVVRP